MAKHNDKGQTAEDAVAEYLRQEGHKILDRNWKTKWCEVDIIAKKDGVVHFVEVKYRGSTGQGGGFEYITPKKLKQMAFATQIWVSQNSYEGEYVLSGAQVDGEFKVEYLEVVG